MLDCIFNTFLNNNSKYKIKGKGISRDVSCVVCVTGLHLLKLKHIKQLLLFTFTLLIMLGETMLWVVGEN